MTKYDNDTPLATRLKRELGKTIKEVRTLKDSGGISQRKLAEAVKIPPSNMKYIEDGVNAPSPRVYEAIIRYLNPEETQLENLDRLYSAVRETPPPDVCRIVCGNAGMNDALRIIEGRSLEQSQMDKLKELLTSFCGDAEDTASANPQNA